MLSSLLPHYGHSSHLAPSSPDQPVYINAAGESIRAQADLISSCQMLPVGKNRYFTTKQVVDPQGDTLRFWE